MSIAWEQFTPLPSLAGGALIGLAAALLYRTGGRIAGVSGILGRSLRLERDGLAWRLAFLAGLLAAPWFAGQGQLWQAQAASIDRFVLLLAAGVLTGIGTRLANGCTSGHGVCGLSRLSLRSLAAVVVFMGAGMATVTLLRHGLGSFA